MPDASLAFFFKQMGGDFYGSSARRDIIFQFPKAHNQVQPQK